MPNNVTIRPAQMLAPRMAGGVRATPVTDYRGEQMQQMGGALMNASQALLRVQAQQAQEANRVRVLHGQNAAMRAAHELTYGTGQEGARGFTLVQGESALAGENGQDLTTAYGQRLRERLDAIEAEMGNDTQRQAFAVWRGQFEADFSGRVQRHQAAEFEKFQKSAYEGAVALNSQRAAADWQSPEKVLDAIEGVALPGSATERYGGVRQAAMQAAQAQGMSANQAEVFVRAAVSRAHLGVLEQAVGNGASAWAQEYIDRHKADILPGELLKVQRQIADDLQLRENNSIIHHTFQRQASRFAPTDLDRLVSVVRQLESGGQGDYGKDGQPLTSRAGARYAMQVMPATAKAPGFGIRPAADDSPEEYNRVGREYLAALSQKYGGNVAMTLAAYNGGPAHVDKAVAAARKAGRPQDWPEYLRQFKGDAAFKENHGYLKKGLALYGEGSVTPALPALEEMQQHALAQLRPGANPRQVAQLQQGVERQYNLLVRQHKQRQEQAFADAADALWQSGGNLEKVPPALMNRVPPEKRDELVRMAKTFAGDKTPETDYGLYYELVSKPEQLARANLSQYFAKLAPAERKELIRLQQSLRSGKGEQTLTQVQSVGALVDNLARQIGVHKDPEKMGQVYADVQKRVTQAEQLKGGKLTPQEMRATVAQSFQEVAVSGWLWNHKKPAFAVSPKDELVIPQGARDDIKAALQRHGRPVTEENIQALWRRHQGL